MNNITYSISDSKNSDMDSDATDSSNDNDSNQWSEISLTHKSTNKEINNQCITESLSLCNELCAREMDLELNYSVKYLSAILDYYEIKKTRLNKKGIISKLVEFEMEITNQYIVENRKRLFENFIELKNDTFFSKFIVSNFT